MIEFAVALSLIFFSDLICAKTLLIETESSEEENGSGWLQNSLQNDWGNGSDYNDCKNLRECVLRNQTKRPASARIDPLEKGKFNNVTMKNKKKHFRLRRYYDEVLLLSCSLSAL